jgi:hypothetical protein
MFLKNFSIFLLLLLCSCTKIKEKMGVVTSGPNEYQVTSNNKGLEVPPHYYLPSPSDSKSNADSFNANHSKLDDGEEAILNEIKR